MVVAVNSVSPVAPAQGVAADIALRPGTVIDAQVLKVLPNDFVRIAVSNLAIDVMSEVPLQAGQALQLAVTQTPNGVRLQIVPPPLDSDATSDSAGVTPPLTNLEAMAVSAAVQSAAARQGSLSPLFANLGVAASSESLPGPVQQAAQQVLSVRTALDSTLSGEDVKAAFENSGLFLEQSQKWQGTAAASSSPTPDLKAALIVFRQTLNAWLSDASASQSGLDKLQSTATNPQADLAALSAPPIAPDIGMDEILLAQAWRPVTEEIGKFGNILRDVAPTANAAARAALAGAMPGSIDDVLRTFPKGVQDEVRMLLEAQAQPAALRAPGIQSGTTGSPAHDDVPPPPFRGAATSAQPVASPSIAADTSPRDAVRQLVNDTNAALARQTLLQIASLPDRIDQPGVRADLNVPRWNFEIPFATPQGTAMAQFEISRDGGGDNEGAASAGKVWRARFSLNIEPAGPVHALVSLDGDKTSVRMWAERASTALQLKAGRAELTRALREADLNPGDIVVSEGHAPSPVSPLPGHFLDRAL